MLIRGVLSTLQYSSSLIYKSTSSLSDENLMQITVTILITIEQSVMTGHALFKCTFFVSNFCVFLGCETMRDVHVHVLGSIPGICGVHVCV